MTDDETGLAPFFASARRATPEPRAAFLNAIIADAAEVQAGREAASLPPPAVRAGPPRRRLGGPAFGWAAAFAACLFLGFAAGLAGGADVGTAALIAADDADSPGEAVGAFFDLAALEG